MSLLVLEGCTAAGKSTLTKKLLEKHTNWTMAPEHTPAPCDSNTDLYDRQEMVFKSFIEHCKGLMQKEETYLADFSPFGCVCFSKALGVWKNDTRFLEQADAFEKVCKQYDWNIIAYLSPGAEVIKQRLIHRARPGDDAWNPRFLEILVDEYDKYFANVAINKSFQQEIKDLKTEIDLEKGAR